MANQNVTQLTAQTGSANASSLFYAVTGGTTDTGLPLSVLFNSPIFTGTPTVPGYATSASPTLTGTPLTPTAAVGTNTTQIASTAYTMAAFASPPPIGNTTANSGTFTTLSVTTSATMAAVNLTGTTTIATVNISGLITPSSTIGIKGTVTNDNAQSGSWGEYITNTASSVSLTNGVTANITSISLPAGDWDVSGAIQVVPTSGGQISGQVAGTNTTSATLGALGSAQSLQIACIASASQTLAAPVIRYSLAATTTVYLVANYIFTLTATASGVIRARRVR